MELLALLHSPCPSDLVRLAIAFVHSYLAIPFWWWIPWNWGGGIPRRALTKAHSSRTWCIGFAMFAKLTLNPWRMGCVLFPKSQRDTRYYESSWVSLLPRVFLFAWFDWIYGNCCLLFLWLPASTFVTNLGLSLLFFHSSYQKWRFSIAKIVKLFCYLC